jgi:phosphoserine phosphatase RsbU/P
VKRRYPSHLRLHVEDSTSANSSTSERDRNSSISGIAPDEIQNVLVAFSKATSWAVRDRQPAAESRSELSGHHMPKVRTQGRWRLVEPIVHDGMLDASDLMEIPTVPMDQAQELLASIERLVMRLEVAEETVRRQEAELATSVGVTSHSDRQRETADRLESILDSVCRSIGAVAGAIYLLDDDTSSLKLRSSIGLPKSRLTAPPRELRGSLADLEALLGNAVLLSDIERMREWPSPEPFASALVVPIGSTTMPHGTMWFWSDASRSYSATEVEVANLAAGRVMSEIEHSILGNEIHQSRAIQKQFDSASLTQASMLPDSQILHEDFDVNGWTYQNSSIGGGFHHWDVSPQEMLTFAVGNSNQQGPEGAIVATGIQSIIRTLWNNNANPSAIMRSINDTMWSLQDADWTASLGLIQVNPKTGYGSICSAGEIQSFIVSYRGFRPIGTQNTRVAVAPDTLFQCNRFNLQPGEILLSFSSGIVGSKESIASKDNKKRSKQMSYANLDQNSLLQIVKDMSDEKASDIAGFLARTLPTFERDNSLGLDRSLIIVKNVRKAVR